MLIAEPTQQGAGACLWGDPLDLSCLHETIHGLADEGLFGTSLAEYMLGLAFDVRKALEGQREERRFGCEDVPEATVIYQGERILWPYFLTQLGMLRFSAGLHPTTKQTQAHLYQLESCTEKALLSYDPETGRKCIDWLARFPGLPNDFFIEFISEQTRQYITTGPTGVERFRKLPDLLETMSPMSPKYSQFDATISTSAAQQACSPADLRDLSEWAPFDW